MKNDRRHFKLPREPMKGDHENDRRLRESCTPGRLRDYHIPVTGYDDSGLQEEKHSFWLGVGRKKPYWSSRSGPPFGKPPTGFSESDVGGCTGLTGPPEKECDIGLRIAPLTKCCQELSPPERKKSNIRVGIKFLIPQKAGSETTRLNDHGIGRGDGFTTEQALQRFKKPPVVVIDKCLGRTSTQLSRAFQDTLSMRGETISHSSTKEVIHMARSKLFESSERESMNVASLWFDVGKTYSNFLEYDFTAAINSAGPVPSRRIRYWYPGFHWHRIVGPVPRDSVMVESVRLVLQRWRGVCSFSQSMRSTGATKKVMWCVTFAPQNNVGLENDLLKSNSKVKKYDDISIA